jgi:predicted ATPase
MLQKVSIQNFKSLKDVTLELQKVNLLIGPNNSGKSNFLKGLELWGKYISFQNEQNRFVKTNNDLEEISFKKKKDDLKFEVLFDNELIGCHINSSVDGYSGIDYKMLFDGEPYPASMLSEYFNKHIIDLSVFNENARKSIRNLGRNAFEDIKIYNINSFKLTIPQGLNSVNILNNDCSNLISFLFTLSNNNEDVFKKIQDDFAKCVIDFVRIKTPPINTNEGGKLSLKFFDKEGNDYWASEVSEGVLYFLALICIVDQPNPPKLLLLEEPEKGIHPRRIHEVMKFIFQLAEDKDIQVIMTSHNEHVLEEFALIPEAVFIFDKDEEGATFVKNLQKDVIEPDTKKAIEFGIEPIDYIDRIGENWFMGLMGGVPA